MTTIPREPTAGEHVMMAIGRLKDWIAFENLRGHSSAGIMFHDMRVIMAAAEKYAAASPESAQEDGDGFADDMCPNCVTPWKCNGPHITAESAPPATEGQDKSTQLSADDRAMLEVWCSTGPPSHIRDCVRDLLAITARRRLAQQGGKEIDSRHAR